MRKIFFFAIVVFTVYGCNRQRPKSDILMETVALDTVTTVEIIRTAVPAIYETAFHRGTKYTVSEHTVNFFGITIGKLKSETGKLIACDPMHIEEYGLPFTQQFPVGEFPVQLAIAKIAEEELVAFARINFSTAPAATWKFALKKKEKNLPLNNKDDLRGFGVDGGVGVFLDSVAAEGLEKKGLTNLNAGMYKKMNDHHHGMWKYAMHSFAEHNLALFTTGSGDGMFGCYIGFDVNGKPCRLLVDFNVIDWRAAQN